MSTITSAMPLSSFSAADPGQGFLALLPAVCRHARIRFRRLGSVDREEAVAETVAAAFTGYHRLSGQGQLGQAFVSTLADYATRHTAEGRHIGGHRDAAKDVLSPAAAHRHGVRVFSYDQSRTARSGAGDGWQKQVIEDRRTSVPDLAAFRLDFAAWLAGWSRRERKIIGRMIAGDGTAKVAGRFGITPSRISQLRRKFEKSWEQ